MSDEPKSRGPFAFQQEFSVDQPAPGRAYFISESDWKRIKRMIRETVPYGGGYQVLWSVCGGICASSIFLLISLWIDGSKVPTWAWTVTWVATATSLLVGGFSVSVDRGQRKSVSRTTESILEEMAQLETQHHASQEPGQAASSAAQSGKG
jgi:hypothetical protein